MMRQGTGLLTLALAALVVAAQDLPKKEFFFAYCARGVLTTSSHGVGSQNLQTEFTFTNPGSAFQRHGCG